MALEIERKFLVVSDAFKKEAFKKLKIIQGFLSSVPERTVRVRIIGDLGFLTVKGIGNASGASRYEWEKEIPFDEAKDLLKICEPGVIDKSRYLVKVGIHTFEVDEFYAENKGLVVAEIELSSEKETFTKPKWLGNEVTGITKYYNAALVNNPYVNW
ncbi:CYTH domain-containing protein [Aureibaculum luteum]|uniref:CYTH domain-containing protein n=1 Tax=Aureibaculum luteum TaxID=1548456 RepID=UPI000E52158A|nr:CYTH domain-containing protein [Aureibaculum luteum]